MSDYTPTTENVRQTFAYVQAGLDDDEGYPFVTHIHVETFDRWLAEVERAAAEKALMAVAEDWESGTVEHDEIKYTSDAPLGWSDESVVDAVMSSGPVMDWVRARAKAYRRNEGENDGAL